MSANMFFTVAFSLLSALVSSFLAAYLTYRYTELSWRRRRHFEDIKENCLKKLLSDVERFESHFTLSEGEISGWVKAASFLKEPPASEWCKLFSFGFCDPPTTHYRVLLHDLENHFPELVRKLKKFEQKIKHLCPLYDTKLYELTKVVFNEAGRITTNIPGRDILTEAVIMTLAGYGEEHWPNNKNALKQKGLLKYVKEIVKEIVDKLEETELVKEYNAVRVEGLSLTKEIKEYIVRIMHSHKLPGKCDLL